MKRLFFALWPNDETRVVISAFNDSIISTKFKKVNPNNLHVTLVFLGNINIEAEMMIRKHVDKIIVKPFSLQFDHLEFWKKPRVLCLVAQQCDYQLVQLFNYLKDVAKQCGIKTEEREYKPHITLARKVYQQPNVNVVPIHWSAHSFCLLESMSTPSGVYYQVLQSWNLNA